MSRQYVQYLEGLLKIHGINHASEQDFNQKQHQLKKNPLQQPIDIKQSINESQVDTSLPQPAKKKKISTNMKPQLSGKLVERYSRQMLLKQISYKGQAKITNAKVAVIGCGGIGCPLALYLAGAGVGTLGIFDSDTVEVTNLHRQIAHKDKSIGMKKTTSLKNSIMEFNPNIKLIQHSFVTVESVSDLEGYDLVIDGSDNPQCRYIVNDFCMRGGKRLLSGACIGWQAQITCYGGQNSPCYRCIWGNQQKTSGGCSTLGVVGMLPGFVGIILAIEGIKMIINDKSSLEGNLLTLESRQMTFRKLKLRSKLKECIGCGQNKLQMTSYDYSKHALCSPNTQKLPEVEEISWGDYLQKGSLNHILDVRPSNHFNICHLENMVNIPLERLSQLTQESLVQELEINSLLEEVNEQGKKRVYVSCNRGIASKRASHLLSKFGFSAVSIVGGITEFSKSFDSNVPIL